MKPLSKPPPGTELEAFRAALEATPPFGDAALSASIARFCADRRPLDPADAAGCRERLTEAIELARAALNPPPPPAAATPAQPLALGREGLKALKKIELSVKRLRDDWGEHLPAQLDEIMQMIPEAIKELTVQEFEDKAKGQHHHSFVEEELSMFARFVETTLEEWCVTIEGMVQAQLEEELAEHLTFLDETTGPISLPSLSISLRSKNWQASAEVKVKAADAMGHLNAGAVGQVGMAMMPLAMMLGPAAILAKVGLSAATLAVGFFSSKKKKEQEQALQRSKAQEELSKQLTTLTQQRLEEARKSMLRRIQVYFQEILDALSEYKDDHAASPAMAFQRPPPPPGLSQMHQLMLKSRWLPAFEGYLQSQ